MNFFKTLIAQLLLLTVFTQTIIPATVTYANPPQDKLPQTEIVKVEKPAAPQCKSLLTWINPWASMPRMQRLKEFGNFMVHAIPLKAFPETWKNTDKRFFILFEQPALGLINTPASVFVAAVLKWTYGAIASGALPAFDFFTMGNLRYMGEAWGGYNLTNVFRNWMSLKKEVPEGQRLGFNYWYSVFTYVFFTAADKFVKAKTDQDYAFALGLVSYAMLWPLFSQRMSTYVFAPYMFGRYPGASELNAMYDTNRNKAEMFQKAEAKLEQATLEAEKSKEEVIQIEKTAPSKETLAKAKKKAKDAKAALKLAASSVKWLHFFLDKVADGQVISKARKAQYWGLKTWKSVQIATFMVTLYFLTRWAAVGESPNPHMPLQWASGRIIDGYHLVKDYLSPKAAPALGNDLATLPALSSASARAEIKADFEALQTTIQTAVNNPEGLQSIDPAIANRVEANMAGLDEFVSTMPDEMKESIYDAVDEMEPPAELLDPNGMSMMDDMDAADAGAITVEATVVPSKSGL